MKKTDLFRNLVAVLFLAAGAASCSNENALIDDNQSQQPEAKTQIITVNFGGNDGQTRAFDADGHKTIEVGETIGVLYNKESEGQYQIKADAYVINVDATGKIATISVTLTSANDNAEFAFVYPSTFSIYSSGHYYLYSNSALMTYKLGTQDGTLDKLSADLDYCKAEGTLNGTDLPDNITMENQLSICKFTLLDASNSSDITSAITSFAVSDGTNDYTITRSAAAGPIYVAMLPVATTAFTFAAGDGANTYTKNVASATLQAGYIYNSTLSMTKQVSNVGKILGADGIIYETVADAIAAHTTAAGMIAYEGAETGVAGKINGLCISLIEGAATKQTYASISYTEFPARPTGASDWATPTVMQWMRMLEACGGSSVGSKGEAYTGNFACGNIATMMQNCGGAVFYHMDNNDAYWTSTIRSYSTYGVRICYSLAYNGGNFFDGSDGDDLSSERPNPWIGKWYYRGVFAW